MSMWSHTCICWGYFGKNNIIIILASECSLASWLWQLPLQNQRWYWHAVVAKSFAWMPICFKKKPDTIVHMGVMRDFIIFPFSLKIQDGRNKIIIGDFSKCLALLAICNKWTSMYKNSFYVVWCCRLLVAIYLYLISLIVRSVFEVFVPNYFEDFKGRLLSKTHRAPSRCKLYTCK